MTVATLSFRYEKLLFSTGGTDTIGANAIGRRPTLKLLHVISWLTAAICAAVALIAVFQSHDHKNSPIANMYSFHPWIGAIVVLFYLAQFFIGFAVFGGIIPTRTSSSF